MNERMLEKQEEEERSNNRNRIATDAYASEQFVFLRKCNIENWYILLDGEKCGTQRIFSLVHSDIYCIRWTIYRYMCLCRFVNL